MVEGVPTAIGARGGALGLVEGQELVIVDPRGAQGQTLRPGARFPLTARAPITTAAREGKPAWVQRRAEFVSRFAEGAALAPYASGALAVPVFVGERLAGAMGFPFQEPGRDHGRGAGPRPHRRRPRRAGARARRAVRARAELARGARPRARRGAALPAGRDARGGRSISICAEARRAFGCDVVQIWTPVDDEQLEVAWRDPPSDVIPPGTRIDFADFPGLIEEMRAFRSMFVPNAQERTRGEALRHAQRLGLYSSLRIPIVIGARVRADPGAAVGARDPGAGSVRDRRDAAVRRPGGARDGAGRAAPGAGGDARAAGGHGGARRGGDAERRRASRSSARV